MFVYNLVQTGQLNIQFCQVPIGSLIVYADCGAVNKKKRLFEITFEFCRFASQQGMTGFGTPRNTTYEAEAGELPYEDMKKSETIIPSQAGWNKGDSQKVR